jgi:hypothetical protein
MTTAPMANVAFAATPARRRDVWKQVVFAITLGVGAAAYVIGGKQNASSPSPRVVAITSVPATASAPATSSIPAAPSVRATTSVAPPESTRVAERTPPSIAPSRAEVDSWPVVEVPKKSARTKSARATPRSGSLSLASQPSNLTSTPAAAPAPIVAEAPPAAPAVPLPSRPPPRADPGLGRVAWKVLGVAGGATASNVAHAIDHAIGSWNACYRSGLRARSENIEGSATLRLACDDQGRVVAATLSGFEMPDVAACIRASSTGLTIPNADTGEASATIALTFVVRN